MTESRQLIGNCFEIVDPEGDLLSRGGMGDVYRAVDLQTGKLVAVKALRPEVVTGDPNALARFLREGEALRQLNHPNIVQMVAAIEEGGQHFLVMEYVAGGSLRDLLEQEGALPIARTVEISLDVADALTRAHRIGIVHRDLKPSNVLLAEDGTPRLSDFGYAHLSTGPRLTQAGTVVGTVLYLSPEACRGETLDARADIWAFGVMLYEMLSGQVPFPGETFPEVFMAILGQPVPDLHDLRPEVPDALADLIYRMLEKEREQRIPSVRVIGVELEAVLAGGRKQDVGRRMLGAGGSYLPFIKSRFPAPTPPTERPRHNLPVQSTPFVGREAELSELDRLLSDPDVRLVTVLGPGGMGKTRLALQAAEAQIDRFIHGVYFVSLAPLQSIEAIVPTVAEALSFAFYEGGTPRQELLDYLHEKRLLLLLDNFEHLLHGVDIVVDILKKAPDVTVLATSRARLNVRGEHRFHIVGLDFPDWETPEDALAYSAVKLFMQSARRARPGFELVADDLKYVARICRLVGGMPLGILLAAAWVEMLTPAEVASEIGQSLDILETDLRDVPERQRSIRAVCNHSWKLLTERERAVCQALSVFRGGFTREAAQEVTGASLRELMSLVHKSLLHRAPTGRYEVHELLRHYAAEKLDQSPDADEAAHDSHCAYYAAALQHWEADLKGARPGAAMAEIEADIENVRTAWNWAVARGQSERLDEASEGLRHFYEWRVRGEEGEKAFRAAAEKLGDIASGDGLRVLAKILAYQSTFSRPEPARQLLEQSLALLERSELADQDTRAERAFVLEGIGTRVAGSDRKEVRRLYERSLALCQSLGDRWGAAWRLWSLGCLVWESGALDEARQLVEEGLAIFRDLGSPRGIAQSLWLLAILARDQVQLEEAERLFHEGSAIYQELGERGSRPRVLSDMGVVSFTFGRYAEAHSRLEQSLAAYKDLGFRNESISPGQIIMLGYAKLSLGWYEQACTQGQTGLALSQDVGDRWSVGFSYCLLGAVALAREAYTDAHRLFEESVAVFREAGPREELGWALVGLGVAVRGSGNVQEAQQHLCETLRTAIETRKHSPLMYALSAVALLLADRGEVERAVEFYALASRYPFVANSRWFEDVFGRYIAAAAAALPPEVVAAAQERGRARDLWATVEEMLAELEGWQAVDD